MKGEYRVERRERNHFSGDYKYKAKAYPFWFGRINQRNFTLLLHLSLSSEAKMSNNGGNGEVENANKDHEIDASSTGVLQIPGEPAIIINGVPDVCRSTDISAPCDAIDVAESEGEKGFGEWLEGREVRKLFGGKYYLGVVTEYDKEAGWYRVVYEDGDSEDLDWHELEEVLLPLDIMVPLKTLALKTIKRTKRTGQNAVRSHTRLAKNVARKGTVVNEGGSSMTPNDG